MFTIELKIGKGKLTAQFSDIKLVHRFCSVYGMLPGKCDNCGSEDIHLSHKSPKGNDYFMVACKDCGAELNLHQKKEGGFYLTRGEKMQVYQQDQQGNQQTNQQQNNPQQTAQQHNNFPDDPWGG